MKTPLFLCKRKRADFFPLSVKKGAFVYYNTEILLIEEKYFGNLVIKPPPNFLECVQWMVLLIRESSVVLRLKKLTFELEVRI